MNEIEAILCQLRGCGRSSLYLEKKRSSLTKRQWDRLEKILQKRVKGYPLQYLLGTLEFFGYPLKIKPGILIPRPETEILVEEAIKEIGTCGKPAPVLLDIGTGSGNIAIALAKSPALKKAKIVAVDISDECLVLAKSNAKLNGVEERIEFLKSDIFGCFENRKKKFDFIISNPPYVDEDQFDDLPEDVRHEPKLALLGKNKGLFFYERIEKGARVHLVSGGMLFLEIGEEQAQGIRKIFHDHSVWDEVKFIKDYNDIQRVVLIRRNETKEDRLLLSH